MFFRHLSGKCQVQRTVGMQSSRNCRIIVIAGCVFILIALICNVWTVAQLLNSSWVILSVPKRIVLWIFDVIMIALGIRLICKRHDPAMLKDMVFGLITVFLLAFVLELSLQILTHVSPRMDMLLSELDELKQERKIVDGLFARPNPEYYGHDKNGWRNKSVPSSVDVVAMGDSQTYGWNLNSNQAWPQQLDRAGVKTYNLSFGGYGPVELLLLMDEAIALKPKVVLCGFFTGNDLLDSYEVVYVRNLMTVLRTPDPNFVEQVKLAGERIARASVNISKRVEKHPSPLTLKLRYIKLYDLFRAGERLYGRIAHPKNWESIKRWVDTKEKMWAFSHNGVRTVMTSEYAMWGVNFDDLRVEEGCRVGLKAIRAMRDKALANDAVFMVVILPTKELVFRDVIVESGQDVPESYHQMIRNELLLYDRMTKFFAEEKINSIDTLNTLRQCLREGRQPFHEDSNGHYNEIGQAAIAETVFKSVRPILE